MDRVNAMASGWSHVHSDAATLDAQEAELRRFARRMGAPASAFQAPAGGWLHLDLRAGPRRRALAEPGVRIFESSRALVEHLREHGVRNVPRGFVYVGGHDARCDTCGGFFDVRDVAEHRHGGASYPPRPAPVDLAAEPPFPGHDTVTFALCDPEWVIHEARERCDRTDPHPAEDCGELW